MRTWDSEGPDAPVHGVPPGCRAVPLVELVERGGERVEVRDRRRRQKTTAVVLLADSDQPTVDVDPTLRSFALGAGRRRWATVRGRYGDEAFDLAITLVRARVVQLACAVDERGTVGEPRWWQPTDAAARAAEVDRVLARSRADETSSARQALVDELAPAFPDVAKALANTESTAAVAVVTAAASDLLAGIEHAGPRAFVQSHFGRTKAHDVRSILTSAGVPAEILERLGLRRGDRVGLGGPVVLRTTSGIVDLTPIRGPVVVRLDQEDLSVSTTAPLLLVIENLQAAEIVCARHPQHAVVYTAGQFGSDTSTVLRQLAADRRTIAILDADLGGVRIARRVAQAAPHADIVDVGAWAHPRQPSFTPGCTSIRALAELSADPSVGWLARAILERGYPVEQELATLAIVDEAS